MFGVHALVVIPSEDRAVAVFYGAQVEITAEFGMYLGHMTNRFRGLKPL